MKHNRRSVDTLVVIVACLLLARGIQIGGSMAALPWLIGTLVVLEWRRQYNLKRDLQEPERPEPLADPRERSTQYPTT